MPPHHLVSSQDWAANLPDHLTEIAELLIPARTERTCPRAVNAPATTTTASRNPANPPASATPGRPPSCCTASTPAQHDQLTLRGIGACCDSGIFRCASHDDFPTPPISTDIVAPDYRCRIRILIGSRWVDWVGPGEIAVAAHAERGSECKGRDQETPPSLRQHGTSTR